jgi:hypothetical protein
MLPSLRALAEMVARPMRRDGSSAKIGKLPDNDAKSLVLKRIFAVG